MLNWKVEEGQQLVLILGQGVNGLGIAGAILLREACDLPLSAFPIGSVHDFVR